MQRIPALSPASAPAESHALLDAVSKKLGVVPNIFKTFAHSPAVLKAYLAQSEALSFGVLDAKLREQIAVLTAGTNRCDYCASAHTLLGKGAGVSEAELARNLIGQSSDARTQVALAFAQKIIRQAGQLTDADLKAIRAAGFGDAEIVEIIAHVGMNIFTNYFNHIAGTVVDFPLVSTTKAAA